MHILIVTPIPPQAQAPGAIPLLLYAQVCALLLHHHLTLVTIVGTDPGEKEAIDCLRTKGVDVYPVYLYPGTRRSRWQRRWQLLSTWLAGRYPWRTVWFQSPEAQQTIDHLLATRKFDLIHIEDNAMGIYNYGETIPTLFTEYEVRRPRSVNFHKPRYLSLRQWIFQEFDWVRWARYQKTVWEKFTRIQVFTERDADALQTIAPDVQSRILVNPFILNDMSMTNVHDEVDGEVLFVGNFTHSPNVDAALWFSKDIMTWLRKSYPAIHLSLVGIYPPGEVSALATTDITVTGFVPEIEPYFARAAVIVAPIRIGGGMRMKVLQAMAMGKAVVTTSRGAEGLTVSGCEPPLVIAEDAEGFAQATAELLASPEARQALGRKARAFVMEHFSPTAYLQRLECIYAELLQSNETGNL